MPVTLDTTDSGTDPLPSRFKDFISSIQVFTHIFRVGYAEIIPVNHGVGRQVKPVTEEIMRVGWPLDLTVII